MTRFELTVLPNHESRAAAASNGWGEGDTFWQHHSYCVDDITVFGTFDAEDYTWFRFDVECSLCGTHLESVSVQVNRFSSLDTNDRTYQYDGPCEYCSRSPENSDTEDPWDSLYTASRQCKRDVEEEGDLPAVRVDGLPTNADHACGVPDSIYSNFYGLRFDTDE
jgi:hypothetical protein